MDAVLNVCARAGVSIRQAWTALSGEFRLPVLSVRERVRLFRGTYRYSIDRVRARVSGALVGRHGWVQFLSARGMVAGVDAMLQRACVSGCADLVAGWVQR